MVLRCAFVAFFVSFFWVVGLSLFFVGNGDQDCLNGGQTPHLNRFCNRSRQRARRCWGFGVFLVFFELVWVLYWFDMVGSYHGLDNC